METIHKCKYKYSLQFTLEKPLKVDMLIVLDSFTPVLNLHKI